MSAISKKLLRTLTGIIPMQYFNKTADRYEAQEGSDGATHVKLTGSKALQLPDINTGSLAAGATYTEPTWNDLDNYRLVISSSAESLNATTSWRVENHFNDVNSGNRFGFDSQNNASVNAANLKSDVRLRYFKNFVRNDDTVARTFIVKRRAFSIS